MYLKGGASHSLPENLQNAAEYKIPAHTRMYFPLSLLRGYLLVEKVKLPSSVLLQPSKLHSELFSAKVI